MDSACANTPITIDDKGESNWYTQTITRKARSSIPDHFKSLPHYETLKFKNRESFSPTVHANWPQEALPMVMVIGDYEGDQTDTKQNVYAFVHGQNNNLVGYFLVKQDLGVFRLTSPHLREVEFEEPFCDLGDRTLTEQTVRNRVRAVILHYFLAARHMREFANYGSFWVDFTKACACIAKEASRTKLQDARPAPATTLPSDPDAGVSAPDATSSKKRGRVEEPKATPAMIKRREFSHAMRQRPIVISRSSSPEHPIMTVSLEARLKASEAANDLLKAEIAKQKRSLEVYQARAATNRQLQTQITSLTAEVSRVKNECSYSQNAYRGIQVQYDDLRSQRVNAVNDGEGLREQLRQSESRRTKAEKRTRVLEKEVEVLRRKIGEAKRALDDPSL